VVGLVVTGIKCQDVVDCTYSDNCNAEAGNIAHYTCAPCATSGSCDPTEKCTCDGGSSCLAADEITDTAETISTSCKTLCSGEANSACEFFKFTTDPVVTGGNKHCYLMNKDQCTAHGGSLCNVPEHCVSGGIHCDGTDPPTIPPGQNKCELTTGFAYDPSGNSLHWLCRDKDNVNFDIYAGTEVGTGTVCTTHHRCHTYVNDDYILRYKCQDNGDGSAGEWKSMGTEDYNDNVLDADSKLKEPGCLPDPETLTLSKYPAQKTEGMMVTCIKNEISENGEVTAPNECIVMCDYYPILKFSPDWVPASETGEKKWMYEGLIDDVTINAGENNIVDESLISCYE